MPRADDFRKKKPGDPPGLSSHAWNGFLDLLHPNNGRQGSPLEPAEDAQHTILIRNDSGADRQRFDILGLGSPLIDHGLDSFALDEFARRITFEGVAPNHTRKFAVLQEPLPADAIGRAIIAGVTICRTNGAGSQSFAKAVNGQYGALDLADDGSAEILWRDGTGSDKLAIVRLGSTQGAAEGLEVGPQGILSTCQDPPAGQPLTETCSIYRPFNSTTLIESGIECSAPVAITIGAQLGLIASHFIDVESSSTVRDGVARTAGTSLLNYADGDRIALGGVNYAVVFVEVWGGFRRAFALRDVGAVPR